jgi:hypothetical protein
VLSWWRPERVLLVGSRRAVATSSALGLLGDAAVTWFDAVRANPRWLQVAELVRLLERSRPDVVVALGGGSALDTAKLGRVLADPAPKPRPKLRKNPPRLVLVPTDRWQRRRDDPVRRGRHRPGAACARPSRAARRRGDRRPAAVGLLPAGGDLPGGVRRARARDRVVLERPVDAGDQGAVLAGDR